MGREQCDQIGQLFKAICKNYFAQIVHIFGNFCKGVKIFHFSSAIIFGQLFTDTWRHFTGHTGREQKKLVILLDKQ